LGTNVTGPHATEGIYKHPGGILYMTMLWTVKCYLSCRMNRYWTGARCREWDCF